MIGRITLGPKRAGVRSAGNTHAAYEVAGTGDGAKVALHQKSFPYRIF
jgi:hypothetical protein